MIRRPPRSTLFPHDALPISPVLVYHYQHLSFLVLRSNNRNELTSCSINIKQAPGIYGSSSACTSRRRSEEHTSELQSRLHLVCRLLLEKKKKTQQNILITKT